MQRLSRCWLREEHEEEHQEEHEEEHQEEHQEEHEEEHEGAASEPQRTEQVEENTNEFNQALFAAVRNDLEDEVIRLISQGADVNAETSLDQTPLQLALPRRNTATIELLRKHGAEE